MFPFTTVDVIVRVGLVEVIDVVAPPRESIDVIVPPVPVIDVTVPNDESELRTGLLVE